MNKPTPKKERPKIDNNAYIKNIKNNKNQINTFIFYAPAYSGTQSTE